MSQLFKLIEREEAWKIVIHEDRHKIQTPYSDEIGYLPIKHPVLVHLDIYAKHPNPEIRYNHMKIAHDRLWPDTIWHYWTGRRFREHCEQWNYITLAGGASCSKSYDIAKLAILFWYANPTGRNVTVASVTLSSLLTRVWGYLTHHIKTMAIPLPYKYYRSSPPKILFEELASTKKNKIDDDTLHGIFAVTAKTGDDDQAVATWIGKHPREKILLILDEATDMPMSILNALPNLNSHPEKFQLIAIGNSKSTMDLHGILSTPANGWGSISTDLVQWNTTQPHGTCLYFSPYESPAAFEPDQEKRELLEKFLLGKDSVKLKEKELGRDSENFYRWVLGFWKSRNLEDVTVSEAFLGDEQFYRKGKVEWSGTYPIQRVAGLDPAFSTDGDKCLLRIALVGHSMDNKVKIDLGETGYTHEIKLYAISDKPLERQIAEETIRLLKMHQVTLDHLAIDVTGQGRAIAEVISLVNSMQGYPLGFGRPLKVYSHGGGSKTRTRRQTPDVLYFNAYALWTELREYIEHGHIAGLDNKTHYQLTNRRILSEVVKGHLIQRLESKLEYKRRMSAIGNAHSPDDADAAALLVQVVKQRLGITPGTVWAAAGTTEYKESAKLIAHFAENKVDLVKQTYSALESDMTSGLDEYIKYWRPF